MTTRKTTKKPRSKATRSQPVEIQERADPIDDELCRLAVQILQLSELGRPEGLLVAGAACAATPALGAGHRLLVGGNPPQAEAMQGQLQQKSSLLAQQGFRPQPGTRVLVHSALGYNPFQQGDSPV